MNSTESDRRVEKRSPNDLEVKDAQLIFNSVLKQLEADLGRENLCFPRELILLGGAPGAGKGTNTNYIRKVRDISAEPIVVSQLLDSPEAKAIKARGGMVGDREVINILLRELLKPVHQSGAILDGFPRTKVQVECLKMLHSEMLTLRRYFLGTEHESKFKNPCFHIMVLFVEENESIERQLKRGREVIDHNNEVKRTGTGTLLEERPTDFDRELARNRYRVFKEKTYDALVSLKQIFHYHFINAQAPLEVVKANILKELEYQSSLELDPQTYHSVSRLPVSSDILAHARRDLVSRLDEYEMKHSQSFHKVIQLIQDKMMPIIVRHAIPGYCSINSEDPLLDDPLNLKILIDVFSERGFNASVDLQRYEVPVKFDLQTGEVHCREKKVYRIAIRFKGSEIRRG